MTFQKIFLVKIASKVKVITPWYKGRNTKQGIEGRFKIFGDPRKGSRCTAPHSSREQPPLNKQRPAKAQECACLALLNGLMGRQETAWCHSGGEHIWRLLDLHPRTHFIVWQEARSSTPQEASGTHTSHIGSWLGGAGKAWEFRERCGCLAL